MKIAVLGASGWIGRYLVRELAQVPGVSVTALFRTKAAGFSSANVSEIYAPDSLLALEKLPPHALIHLGRGEEEKDFETNCALFAHQKRVGGRILYASSFNACDADISKPHRESDLPASQSDYGKFKARCERELANSFPGSLIFRFPSIHGWSENREARTQTFLKKLQNGETVPVNTGVIQNRAFVGDLAKQISKLAVKNDLSGVFHLGTSDSSEELVFMRALANAFGYPESQVTEDIPSPCNAVMLMENFPKAFPSYQLPKEADTIARVAAQPELTHLYSKKMG